MHSFMKSIVALFTGFMAVVLLSVIADSLVFPRDRPGHANGLYLLATVYRGVFAVAGSFVAAQMAPARPMLHALILGVLGTALAVAGAVLMWGRGPNWYPVALVITALPCAWLGGVLQREYDRRTSMG